MPKDFELMTYPERADFMLATDSVRMRPLFVEKLGGMTGETIKIKSFFVTRAYPRKDGGFSIQYELNFDQPDKSTPKKLLLWGHLLASSQPTPGYISEKKNRSFFIEDIRLAVPVFPYDPELKHLGGYFGTGEKTRQKLRSVPLLRDKDFEITECQVLGYRLERRCVLRYTLKIGGDRGSEKRQVVVKVGRPSHVAKVLEISRRLSDSGFADNSSDCLTVPRIFAVDQESGAIFMEAVPGKSLHSLIDNPDFHDYCHSAGAILAKFHSMTLEHLHPYSVSDEIENLREIVDFAIEIFPVSGDIFSAAIDRLTAHGPDRNYPSTCVHRDFYDKQILFSPKRITLLDCENAAISDPALDLGNFEAHLALRELQSPDSSSIINKGLSKFENCYCIADKGFKVRAGWWRAASLIRLAALYSFRPRWRSVTAGLLKEADSFFTHNKVFSGEKV